jgi:hypothetical protein
MELVPVLIVKAEVGPDYLAFGLAEGGGLDDPAGLVVEFERDRW